MGQKRKSKAERKHIQECLNHLDERIESLNEDPLILYDVRKKPIGHVLRNLWRGRAGFIVGGGPSLNELDVELLRGRGICAMGVNNVAAHVPVSAMVHVDPQSKFHHAIYEDPKIMVFTPEPKMGYHLRVKSDGKFYKTNLAVRHMPNCWGYNRHKSFEASEFLKTDNASWGRSKGDTTGKPFVRFSFLVALRLMHYLGVRRVYLIGVDFNMKTAKPYAFGQSKDQGAVNGNTNYYHHVNQMCHELLPYFEEVGYEVYNCNPQSGLSAFPHVPYDAAIKDCRGYIPEEPFDLADYYTKDNNVGHIRLDIPNDRFGFYRDYYKNKGEDPPA